MLRRLSLRTRLVLGVVVLAAAGLVAADAATYTSLRSFLVQRVDNTLESDHGSFEHGRGPDGGQSGSSEFVQYRTRDGTTVLETRPGGPPGQSTAPAPRLPTTISMRGASQRGPDTVRYFTVPGQSGGDRYRVRASYEGNSTDMLIVALSLHDVDG